MRVCCVGVLPFYLACKVLSCWCQIVSWKCWQTGPCGSSCRALPATLVCMHAGLCMFNALLYAGRSWCLKLHQLGQTKTAVRVRVDLTRSRHISLSKNPASTAPPAGLTQRRRAKLVAQCANSGSHYYPDHQSLPQAIIPTCTDSASMVQQDTTQPCTSKQQER